VNELGKCYRRVICIDMNLLKSVLGLIYPTRCCFCGEVSEKEICAKCAKKVEYITEPRCKKCGRPVRYEEKEYCYECQKLNFHYECGKNIWLHKTPVSSSIYQYKYKNRRIYGEFYAKEMYRLFRRTIESWEIDLIVPVPLHKKRRRLRGYNQSEIIAKHLGKMLGIPVDTKYVIRKRNTRPQKELDNKERRKNVQHAFEVKKGWKTPKHVLLIDDIYTTGSTLDAVAEVILHKGVSKVWFLTISIGQNF